MELHTDLNMWWNTQKDKGLRKQKINFSTLLLKKEASGSHTTEVKSMENVQRAFEQTKQTQQELSACISIFYYSDWEEKRKKKKKALFSFFKMNFFLNVIFKNVIQAFFLD